MTSPSRCSRAQRRRLGEPSRSSLRRGADDDLVRLFEFLADKDLEAAERAIAEATERLGHLQAFGLRPIGDLEIKPVHEEDWAAAWKQHFPVMRIGRHLVIRPTWRRHRAQPRPGISLDRSWIADPDVPRRLQLLERARVLAQDSESRPLPRWRACRRLGEGEFFVFSNRIPNSFDSRYYGPVRREAIVGVFRLIMTRIDRPGDA